MLEFVETRGDELLARSRSTFAGPPPPPPPDSLRAAPRFGEAAITRAIEGMDACITARAALEPQLHAYLARVK